MYLGQSLILYQAAQHKTLLIQHGVRRGLRTTHKLDLANPLQINPLTWAKTRQQ